MKRNQLISLILFIILGATLIYYFSKPNKTEASVEISTSVKEGQFKVSVSATGELEAKRSKKIMGPSSMRNA